MKKPRRRRLRQAKPGELAAHFGYTRDWGEAVHYCNGVADVPLNQPQETHLTASKSDAGFLSTVFEQGDAGYGRSFLAELEYRGYDLKTLKFSIMKNQPT